MKKLAQDSEYDISIPQSPITVLDDEPRDDEVFIDEKATRNKRTTTIAIISFLVVLSFIFGYLVYNQISGSLNQITTKEGQNTLVETVTQDQPVQEDPNLNSKQGLSPNQENANDKDNLNSKQGLSPNQENANEKKSEPPNNSHPNPNDKKDGATEVTTSKQDNVNNKTSGSFDNKNTSPNNKKDTVTLPPSLPSSKEGNVDNKAPGFLNDKNTSPNEKKDTVTVPPSSPSSNQENVNNQESLPTYHKYNRDLKKKITERLDAFSGNKALLLEECERKRKFYTDIIDSIPITKIEGRPEKYGNFYATNNVPPHGYSGSRYTTYDSYDFTTSTNLTDYLVCNALHDIPERSATIVMTTFKKQYSPDFFRHLTASVIEFGWGLKIDFYILYQVTDLQNWDISKFPPQFHPIVVPYLEYGMMVNDTLRQHKIAQEYLNRKTPMSNAEYLMQIWFSGVTPQYEYYWVFEDDIRATSPWTYLVPTVLDSFENKTEKIHLLCLSPVRRFEPLYDYRMPGYEHLLVFVFINRMSRTHYQNMLDAVLHDMYAFVEFFVPTVASVYGYKPHVYVTPVLREEGNNWQVYPFQNLAPAVYANLDKDAQGVAGDGTLFHGYLQAMHVYSSWLNNETNILPMTVFHPIKL